MAVCEELRGFASATLSLPPLKDPVICPKPRRVGHFANHPSLSMRWCIRSAHAEQVDSQAGSELLDLIRAKVNDACMVATLGETLLLHFFRTMKLIRQHR